MSAAIRSTVRLRPLATDEESAWRVQPDGRICLRREVLQREGRADWLADSEYAFDAVFAANASTADVYAQAAADLIPLVVGGKNCTVLAYGQTASGKVRPRAHPAHPEAPLQATRSRIAGTLS